MPVNPATGQTEYDPRLLLGQALLRRQNQPRTAIEGANNAANSIVGAILTRRAMEEREAKDAERTKALGAALSAFQAGDQAGGMAALQGSNDPRLLGAALERYMAPQEPLSPRDKAFASLTPEQQARALGGLPSDPSIRDQAFANLTPEQQTRALGAAPPTVSPRDQAFASLTPEQQAVALGATPQMSPRDKAFVGLTPEQQAIALGVAPMPQGPLSPREAAFADLTPEQQARALGAMAPDPSARDKAFADLTPEQQARALGAVQNVSPRDEAFANLTPEQQTQALGASTAPNSAGDVTAPILAKLARGEELTAGEQRALDVAANLDPMKVLMRQLLAPPAGATGAPLAETPGPGAAPAETSEVTASPGAAQAAEPAAPQVDEAEAFRQAREALARAPNKRGAIERRLKDLGFDPGKL